MVAVQHCVYRVYLNNGEGTRRRAQRYDARRSEAQPARPAQPWLANDEIIGLSGALALPARTRPPPHGALPSDKGIISRNRGAVVSFHFGRLGERPGDGVGARDSLSLTNGDLCAGFFFEATLSPPSRCTFPPRCALP